MAIVVTFACGHTQTVPQTANAAACAVCGTDRVVQVTAPAPRFTGAVQPGPCVQGGVDR